MPLGSTAAVGVSAMINLIGEIPESAEVLNVSNAHLHLYGKEPRMGRKLGHVTVRAESLRKVTATPERAAGILSPARVLPGKGFAGIASEARLTHTRKITDSELE